MPSCVVCGTTATSRCSKCRNTAYCGVTCQTKDWKMHKKRCGKTSPSTGESGPTFITAHLPDAKYPPSFSPYGQSYNVFTGKSSPLSHSASYFCEMFGYVASNPEKVYADLVDTFRLRRLKDAKAGKPVGSEPAPTAFVDFLAKVKKAAILPDWWDDGVHESGLIRFVKEDQWGSLHRVVSEEEILAHHSEGGTNRPSHVELRLNMLGERIWGSP